MTKEIVILDEAKFELIQIKNYYNSYDKNYSKLLIKKLLSTIYILKEFNDFGKICSENLKFRELICGRYRILYKNEKENNCMLL